MIQGGLQLGHQLVRHVLVQRQVQLGTVEAQHGLEPGHPDLARQVGVTGLKTVLRFNSAELYLALNKNVPDELVAKLQAALDQLRDEGVIADIMGRYL